VTRLPDDDVAFYLAAVRQLPPQERPVFEQRVAAILRAQADPGPGDVDRAVRAALAELWTPPADTELRPPRWDRDAPRFEKVSRRDW
jgi:hypothetical protein